ncbi:MAG: D-alanine--D-alanine ligase [Candidatus Paceibacterota bacterium]|jgi:D-alanine-D-alanine ligase
MKLTRVGILHGGPSSEYEVSLKTAKSVKKNLPVHYEAVDIFVDKKGDWHVHGLKKSPHDAVKHLDVIFNAMHGEYGEDGTVQGLLDNFGVPYTGSGKFASAVAMNKALSKEVYKKNGLKTPLSVVVEKGAVTTEFLHKLHRSFPFPVVVKPVGKGSSVGISIAKTLPKLIEGLELAFSYGDRVLLEEFIAGREATCGVIEQFRGKKIYSLPPVEIRKPKTSSFFDFDAKYGGTSEEICPGNFSEKEKKEIERMAVEAHKALGLLHYSRSDFIVTPRRGIYILETNNLPGLTEESLLPKSLNAVGATLNLFLDHLITLALHK